MTLWVKWIKSAVQHAEFYIQTLNPWRTEMTISGYGSVTEDTLENIIGHVQSEDVNNRRGGDNGRSSSFRLKNFILGASLSIISGVLFTANNFIINQYKVVVSDAVIVRCIIQTVLYSIVIQCSGDVLLPGTKMSKFLTLSQGLAGALSFITALASVSFMPVPDALCIIFSCPVVTIFLSAAILNDKLNSVKLFSGAILVLGILLVCQPPFLFAPSSPEVTVAPAISYLLVKHDDSYFIGVALAIVACFTGGFMDVLAAKCEEVSTFVLVTWSAISGFIITVAASPLLSDGRILSKDIVNISLEDWLLFIGLAVSGLMAFTCLTAALKLISPNLVSSLRTLELVFAFTAQSLVTGQDPEMLPCLGGFLILAGVLTLTFQERILELMKHGVNFVAFNRASEYERLLGGVQ